MNVKDFINQLTKDVVDARLSADKNTQELVTTYEQDAFLRLLPVPRVNIKNFEASLKVCFEQRQSGLANANSNMDVAFQEVVQNIFLNLTNNSEAREVIKAYFQKVPLTLVSLLVDQVFIIYKKLPPETQKILGNESLFQKQVQSYVRKMFPEILKRFYEVFQDKTTEEVARIILDKDQLQAMDPNKLSELKVSLSLDDVQMINPNE